MLHDILRLAHLLGFAGVGLGLAKSYQAADHHVSKEVLWSVILQIISGFLLVASEPDDVNHIKVTVKLGIAIILGIFLWTKRGGLRKNHLHIAMLLYLANTIIAVMI